MFKSKSKSFFLRFMTSWILRPVDRMNFTIEMETGTGKTYVYLRTMFELNKKYGIHVAFEGGEGETEVIDGPIFRK